MTQRLQSTDTGHGVRPLAIGSPGIIAQAMGWNVPYALGVLAV
jgi:hypothetical protein